jgi:alkylation response protein AidB-like acyl-CoA dehydrogenase
MDFELTSDQQMLLATLDAILERHLPPHRARELIETDEYDDTLEAALRDAGFFELFTAGEDAGPLEAILAVERIAASLGSVTTVAHMVVLPALGLNDRAGAVALTTEGTDHPVLYGAHARTLIRFAPSHSQLLDLDPSSATPLPTVFGYPVARLPEPAIDSGSTLPPGSGEYGIDWWRIGLAAEAVGLMGAALEIAVQYAKDRTVFRRPIGSFQALQHRLAECSVAVEGARWLVYEAATCEGQGEAAATAAAYTVAALTRLIRETHQVMGAIGLTREHDLHLWTFRMQALRTQLGGLREHRRRLVEKRWMASDHTASPIATSS